MPPILTLPTSTFNSSTSLTPISTPSLTQLSHPLQPTILFNLNSHRHFSTSTSNSFTSLTPISTPYPLNIHFRLSFFNPALLNLNSHRHLPPSTPNSTKNEKQSQLQPQSDTSTLHCTTTIDSHSQFHHQLHIQIPTLLNLNYNSNRPLDHSPALDLQRCNIGDAGAALALEVLDFNSNLVVIDLRDNDIGTRLLLLL